MVQYLYCHIRHKNTAWALGMGMGLEQSHAIQECFRFSDIHVDGVQHSTSEMCINNACQVSAVHDVRGNALHSNKLWTRAAAIILICRSSFLDARTHVHNIHFRSARSYSQSIFTQPDLIGHFHSAVFEPHILGKRSIKKTSFKF